MKISLAKFFHVKNTTSQLDTLSGSNYDLTLIIGFTLISEY